ncbi:MAG TPA: DUF1707 domain-containing protein [Propionibacteriaceae bacterium]|nr:DUF1707 domain-containing protein [Propionibacteriaceae bacterium]
MPSEEFLRAADAERDRVITHLSDSFAVGRLSADELDQRLDRALRARTRAELQVLLADLPAVEKPAERNVRRRTDPAARLQWALWMVTALVCLAVWVATSVAHGSALYFWPVWVIGPWGVVLAAHSVAWPGRTGLSQGCPSGGSS